MKITDTRALRLFDVLLQDWLPAGNGLMRAHMSSVFPHTPTLYILTRDEEIVYVGQTGDLKIRLAQHACSPRMALLRWDTAHWLSPGVPGPADRLQFEAMLICALLPEANRAIMLVKNKAGKLCEVRWGERTKMAMRLKEAERNSIT